MYKKTLVIPAAGSGSRLNEDIPKPYLKLAGKTILEHTISRFLKLERLEHVIIAASETYRDLVEKVLDGILPGDVIGKWVAGGSERQHSIFNALQKADTSGLIVVHDAVRPFVTPKHIDICCRTASEFGAAVLGVPVRDTIKKVGTDNFIRETPSRKELWQTQTPQVFRGDILMEAYEKAFKEKFIGTDDASLVERIGYKVKMIEGDHSNFKITYPLDLKLAHLMIEKKEGKL